MLEIPRSARFTLSDGQHRVAAIAHALREDPRGLLSDEAIPVVLFIDTGLARSQQALRTLTGMRSDQQRLGVDLADAPQQVSSSPRPSWSPERW